jgi:hypothetical protein
MTRQDSSAGAPDAAVDHSVSDQVPCPSGAAGCPIHVVDIDAAPPASAGDGILPDNSEAQPVDTAAPDSARFVPPPSLIFGSDPFNIGDLENRDWDKPVFNQEYVGTHLNDLMRFFCILRDLFRECVQRVDKRESPFAIGRNPLDFCYTTLKYRTLLLAILEFFQAELNSNLEKIKHEMNDDKIAMAKLPVWRGGTRHGPDDSTQKMNFADTEETFKIYGLLNQVEDGMVNHLTGIMNRWSPGDIHKREALQALLREAEIS